MGTAWALSASGIATQVIFNVATFNSAQNLVYPNVARYIASSIPQHVVNDHNTARKYSSDMGFCIGVFVGVVASYLTYFLLSNMRNNYPFIAMISYSCLASQIGAQSAIRLLHFVS